ncbi:hypothetical protein PCE1_000174 [Barthelona sp. PCE]
MSTGPQSLRNKRTLESEALISKTIMPQSTNETESHKVGQLLSTYEQKISLLEKQNSEYRHSLQNLDSRFGEIATNYKSLESNSDKKLKEANFAVLQYQTDNETLLRQNHELCEKNDKLIQANTELSNKLNQISSKFGSLVESQEQLMDQNGDLLSQNTTLKGVMDELKRQLINYSEIQGTNTVLTQKLEELESMYLSLKTDHEDTTKQNFIQSEEIENLRAATSLAKKGEEGVYSRMQELLNRCTTLQDELNLTLNKLQHSEQYNAELERDVQMIQKDFHKQLQSRESVIIEQKNIEIQQIMQKCQEIQKRELNLESKMERILKEKQTMQNLYNENLKNHPIEINRYHGETQRLAHTISMMEKKLDDLTHEHGLLQTKYSNVKENSELLEMELRTTKKNLNSENDSLKTQLSEYVKLSSMKDHEISSTKKEMDHSREMLEERNRILTMTNSELNDKLTSLNQKYSARNKEFSDIIAQQEAFQKTHREETMVMIDDYECDVSKLKERLRVASNKLQQGSRLNEKLRRSEESLREELQHTQRTLQSIQSELNMTQSTLRLKDEALTGAKRYMSDQLHQLLLTSNTAKYDTKAFEITEEK